MAKKVITVLTDDLDGGVADHTIEFGLDGVHYTIDLSEQNAGNLRRALRPYLVKGTRVAVPTREHNKALRQWAAGQGYALAHRGRIPNAVVDAYQRNRDVPA
jgi:hypothetical protein